MLAGGIDLGGSKIDARLFDPDHGWTLVDHLEISTPRADYDDLVEALAGQVSWLRAQGAGPVGLGAPGLVGHDGRMLTANLPATGRQLPHDLARATGGHVPVLNDCRAFTLSEAVLGAGREARSVLGLVMGTGMAGGFSCEGRLIDGINGQAGEYGHTPLAHVSMRKHDLPVLECGCGRRGCYETYCSGPGLVRLATNLGYPADAAELGAAAAAGDEAANRVLGIWAELVAGLLTSLVFTLDPDVIVLGGGLSKLPDVSRRLSLALQPELLAGTRAPSIVVAEGGDRSGARGAAWAAWQQETAGQAGGEVQ